MLIRTTIMASIPTITIQSPTPSHSIMSCPSSATSEAETTITTYHIYRMKRNLVLYTVPDHEICPVAKTTHHKPATEKEDDPRKPSYYLHTPCIWFRSPPQTLRFGGKGAPVVCMIDGECFWRKWTLDFTAPPEDNSRWWGRWRKKWQEREKKKMQKEKECKRVDSGFGEEEPAATEVQETVSLNAPTIIDPRGVISSKYRLRSFGLPGETGRDYIRRTRYSQDEFKPHVELPTHLDASEAHLALYWNGWFTRQYAFQYSNIDCRWKGTGTVRDDRKYWGKWSRYNHLKLVAYLPLDSPSSSSSSSSCIPKETHTPDGNRLITLAKYTSLWAKRKVGRLSVFERGLEECFPDDPVERERLRHVLVATAMCMIQGEKEKREKICKIVELLLGAGVEGGSAAPG
ncbi:hypothetical protein K440DRAFT_359260 [Wilcoxina mikolae CBS 423.85]|nr:hypothetical protein K440DRAFT_359260 [Wilcoxina mikolae CBS 423.85]